MTPPTIEELSKEADRIINLSMLMNDTFDKDHTVQHHKMSLMAGLLDMWKQGYRAANEFKITDIHQAPEESTNEYEGLKPRKV